jgi:hypothetical protein
LRRSRQGSANIPAYIGGGKNKSTISPLQAGRQSLLMYSQLHGIGTRLQYGNQAAGGAHLPAQGGNRRCNGRGMMGKIIIH